MKLAFGIAKRFLTSAKKQTIVIILGIAVGVSVQVFIGALINGLQANLIDTAIGTQSQITISHEIRGQFIDDYEDLLITLDANDDIAVASPSIATEGVMSFNGQNINVSMKGENLDRASQIYRYDERLTESDSVLPSQTNEVLLGIGLKDLLNVDIGDSISYLDTNSNSTSSLTVTGFVDFKSLRLNNSSVITLLSTTQSILNMDDDQVFSIEMQVNDVFAADEISQDIKSDINNEPYTVVTWIEQNQDLLTGLEGQSISSLMIQIFVIISVVLGISSVLAITVLQKSKQLGILKAMGIQDKDASKIFLFEGLLLGVFGAILGILLGIGLLYAFDVFADTGIPITIDPAFLALSAGIAITASTLASLSPAIKSSKLSVIEVIRNG
jgi:lipoprotein-releasing system permease protein